MKCKVCGNEIPEGTTICSICGTPVEEPEPVQGTEETAPVEEKTQSASICPVCGKPLQEGAKFCNHCGADVTAAKKSEETPAQKVCPKCGSPVLEGAMFCNTCGARLDGTAPTAAPAAAPAAKTAPVKMPSFKLTKKAKAAIAAVLAVLLLVVGFKALYKPTINLNKYVTVEFSGADGYGKTTLDFDTKELYEDYSEKIKFNYKAAEKFIDEYDEFGSGFENYINSLSPRKLKELKKGENSEELFRYAVGTLEQYVIFPKTEPVDEIIKYNRLSNGNKVRLIWGKEDYTDDVIKSFGDVFGVKFKYADKEYTVKDLDKVSAKDVFADVTVEFSGTAPDGRAEVVNKSDKDEIKYLDFELDKYSGLSNGDTVTVTIYGDESDISAKFAENYGYVPESFSKEFTVSGLDHYITTIDEMPESDMEKIAAQMKDQLTSVTSSWVDGMTIESMEYMGSYLLTRKEGAGNALTYVYTVNAKYDADGITGEMTYYYPIEYTNIVMKADGTTSLNVLRYSTPNNSFTKTFESESDSQKLWFYGYESVADLEKKLIQPYVSNYTVTKDFE